MGARMSKARKTMKAGKTRKQRGGSDLTSEQNNLLNAIRRKDITNIDSLLNQDIDFKNEEGLTPLMLSVLNGSVPFVKALLEKGANKGLEDDDGETASDMANRSSNETIKQLLNPRPISAASTVSIASATTVNSMSSMGSTGSKPQTKRGPWRGGSKTKKHRKTNRRN